jgi:hypothetical protein
MIGLNLSAGLNSISEAYIVIPFILVPQLLFSGVMISFDRLNNLYENPEYVPVIGELMPSRWAYEAVAVHQFKENRYSREFFEIDQVRYNAFYEISRIEDVQQRLNEIFYRSVDGRVPESFEADLRLVRTELNNISKGGVVTSFGSPESFTRSGFNEAIYTTAIDSLEWAKQKYILLRNLADSVRDRRASELVEIWGGEEYFRSMKKDYTNERLEELLVRNSQAFLVEWNGRLVRKFAPIYQVPRSRTARAHFFAPEKKVGSITFDTYWFNVVVIWLLSLIFYFALIYDILRKIVSWNQIRKLRKSQ